MTQQLTVNRPKGNEETPIADASKNPEISEEIATQLVNTSLRVGSEDVVVIDAIPHMTRLATQISIACYKKGADVGMSLHTDDGFFSLMEAQSAEQLSRVSKVSLALAESMTVNISLLSFENPEPLRRVPPEKMAALDRSRKPINDLMLKRGVKTAYIGLSDVTQKRAETYGLDLVGLKKAIETASVEDYSRLARAGARIGELLQGGKEVRVKSSDGTDLRFKLAGRIPRLNDGIIDEDDVKAGAYSIIIPAGDIAVAMAEDSGEGRFVSNVPQPWLGRMVEGVEWHFKQGKITEFKAKNNLSPVKSHYEASMGNKDRIGYLTLGLNTKAKAGQLFNLNHIASGSISIGIGDNKKLGGQNDTEFEFLSTISDGNLTIDGRDIIKNGKYVV